MKGHHDESKLAVQTPPQAKEYTIRDALAMMDKNNRAIMAEMQANMDREWTT